MLFNFKKYHAYLAILWLFFSGVVIFWLLNRLEFLGWLVLGLFLLFLFTTGFVLGVVRHKEKGHPLVDDIEDTPREKIRLKEKTWRQHQALFSFISPLRDAGASWDDIQAKVQTEFGPEYPSSIDTLKDVYQKGKNGFYKNFPKTS